MRTLAIILTFIGITARLFAAGEPVILERATSLKSSERDGRPVQELLGDVWMRKDSLDIFCQRAIYYPDGGELTFRGKVEFLQPERKLFADEVTYNERTEEVNAYGRVHIYQDSLQISCREAIYRERFSSGELFREVSIKDESRNLTLTGDRGYFDHEKEYARVTGSPVLTRRDSTNAVDVRIYGDTLEYFGQEKRARAGGTVIIERDSLKAFGSLLNFHQDSSYAEMIGKPYAVQNFDEITGDTLRMYFAEQKLERLEVLGNAVATSPADSLQPEPRNRMEGKRMQLWIADNVLSRVEITRNAIATYYIREDNQPEGRNVTSGDEIIVFFDGGEISHIEVHGGTQGTYMPEYLVRREASKANQ